MLHGVVRSVVLFIMTVSLTWRDHCLGGNLGLSDTFLTDSINEHIQYPRDQYGQRRTTHRIVCAAAAAAWLPHSKRRDMRMTSG